MTTLSEKIQAVPKLTDETEIISQIKEITKLLQDDASNLIESNLVKSDLTKYRELTTKYHSLLLKFPDKRLKIAILGYASQLTGDWDPFNTKTGLPGSEECAVYAAAELTKKNVMVTVYLSPKPDSIWTSPFSNPKWCPAGEFMNPQNMETYDLVIMWRRFDVAVGRLRSKKVFFWGHDTPQLPGKIMFPKFDGLLVLSKSHYQQYLACTLGFDKIPHTICGNGVLLEQFTNPMSFKNPYSIGYYSNYGRGLIVLLLIWPNIRSEFPTATLDICYGRETWGCIPKQHLDVIIQKIEEYKNMGVTEHGKIGHLPLAGIIQNTSIWAYPCTDMGETFCITAVKCQLAGCIPVTTRIAALDETVHPEAPKFKSIVDMNEVYLCKDKLLEVMRHIKNDDATLLKLEREKYINFAKQFSWSNCVDKWLELYNKVK